MSDEFIALVMWILVLSGIAVGIVISITAWFLVKAFLGLFL